MSKRVTCAIGCDGAPGNAVFTDVCSRYGVKLPVTTTRWRLRIRNRANDGTFTGALTATPVYLCSPVVAAGTWGGNVSTATEALPAFTTPADGSEWTSDWVDDPDLQYENGTYYALSIGFTASPGTKIARSDTAQGTSLYTTGAAAAAATLSWSSLSGISQTSNTVFLDVRLEYEFDGSNDVVLCIGDSITAGFGAGDAPLKGCFNKWPGIAGMSNGFCWINAGVSQTAAASAAWKDASSWYYQRFDLTTTVPDKAIIALGVNDASSSSSKASYIANVTAIKAVLAGLGIEQVYLATPIPQPRWKGSTLRAPSSAGATSVQTGVAYATSDVIEIGHGTATAEQRTVASASTGASSPYTTPLAAATSGAHTTGDTVSIVQDSYRQDYVNWIKDEATGYDGVFDFAAALADPAAPVAGAAFTADGIHPPYSAHLLMAALVSLPVELERAAAFTASPLIAASGLRQADRAAALTASASIGAPIDRSDIPPSPSGHHQIVGRATHIAGLKKPVARR